MKLVTFKLVCETCGTLLLEGTQEDAIPEPATGELPLTQSPIHPSPCVRGWKGTQRLLKKIAANAHPHECTKYALGRPVLKTQYALWSYTK